MASQEHLQQLDEDDVSSSSSSSDDDGQQKKKALSDGDQDTASDDYDAGDQDDDKEAATVDTNADSVSSNLDSSNRPAKMRIKLTLKLPTRKNKTAKQKQQVSNPNGTASAPATKSKKTKPLKSSAVSLPIKKKVTKPSLLNKTGTGSKNAKKGRDDTMTAPAIAGEVSISPDQQEFLSPINAAPKSTSTATTTKSTKKKLPTSKAASVTKNAPEAEGKASTKNAKSKRKASGGKALATDSSGKIAVNDAAAKVSSATASAVAGSKSSSKPKTMRKLRLPMNADRSSSNMDSDDDDEPKVTVVDSDDAGEDDAVAAVVSASAVVSAVVEPTSGTATSAAAKPEVSSSAAVVASSAGTAAAKTRRTANPSRPIRLPPISSPGLLIPPSSAAAAAAAASNASGGAAGGGNNGGVIAPPRPSSENGGYITASSIFDYHMAVAGYSVDGRAKRPHRGSSVTRSVGDMFDSNVMLSLHFPPLVPPELLGPAFGERSDKKKSSSAEENEDIDAIMLDSEDKNSKKRKVSELSLQSDSKLPSMLVESLRKSISKDRDEYQNLDSIPVSAVSLAMFGKAGVSNNSSTIPSSRRRKRCRKFSEMVPVSLTVPYPESFIERRLEYVRQVEQRERAILAYQDAEDDDGDSAKGKGTDGANGAASIVPPIPELPVPPNINEIEDFQIDKYEDWHPYYPPKHKDDFVPHLDRACFHITEGRYFGLETNFVADPNFIGPNAPGIAGVSASAGAGLATSTAGTGSSGGNVALTLSTSYPNATLNATLASCPAVESATNKPAAKNGTIANAEKPSKARKSDKASKSPAVSTSVAKPPTATPAKDSGKASAVKTPSVPTASKEHSKEKSTGSGNGPKPTASASSLRKIMEEGGPLAETMKNCIIRAAVHTSRNGKHGQSFLAPNGETYPDVSKAFAAHAGIKPCQRCKSNKQGAYHCRLRRRHKELDFDGGDSPSVLTPLFTVPMESLLFRPS